MEHFSFYKIADLVLWGTIPLLGLLGYWEHHLPLSDADHKLVQILLVLIAFGWAYMWNRLGDLDRLAHATSRKGIRLDETSIESGMTDAYDSRHLVTKDDGSFEIVERYHVSNN